MEYTLWFHRTQADFWNLYLRGTLEEVLADYFEWKNGTNNTDADAARIEVHK
jgi:hypothetical protein